MGVHAEPLEKVIEGRLTDLVNQEFEIQQDIDELAAYSGPYKKVTQINTFIKEKIAELENSIRLIKQFAKEQDDDKDTKMILEKLKTHYIESGK